MGKIVESLMCLFGFHKMKNISDMGIPEPKEGESISFCRLHKCDKCGKEEMLGMGVIN